MHVPGRHVGTDSMAPVFVLDAKTMAGSRGQDRMTRAADGDLRLLVGADEELIGRQCATAPVPVIEVEDARRFGRELRIAGEDLAPSTPGTQRILMEPPPDRDPVDVGDNPCRQHMSAQLRAPEARRGQPQLGGQFAPQGLHFSDDPREKRLAVDLYANDRQVRCGGARRRWPGACRGGRGCVRGGGAA